MFVLTWSSSVPRRQAEITPVSMPITMEKAVPSETIGMVFQRAWRRFVQTGTWLANETPMFPRASSFT